MNDGLAAVGVAVALEIAVGDPEGWPHPVRGVGALTTRLEAPVRRAFRSPGVAGVVLVLIILALSLLPLVAIRQAVARFAPALLFAFDGAILYLTIAANQLVREGLSIGRHLESGDGAGARENLARIVSRRTDTLDEPGVVRATLETLGENFADGVFNPFFYFLVGGPMAAAAYRVVNTLDSMIGYRNERYREFGRFAARLDDVVNFIPARLAGFLMALSAPLAGLSLGSSVRILWRDGRNHESPNAGLGKAALAGALGVQLGGPVLYPSGRVDRPFIGDDARPLVPARIREASRHVAVASIVTAVIGAAWFAVR